MIKESAIQIEYNGETLIFCGKRHCDCLEAIHNFGIKQPFINQIQGFMTDNGKFIDRYQAYIYAKICGQITENSETPGCLYSEDIW